VQPTATWQIQQQAWGSACTAHVSQKVTMPPSELSVKNWQGTMAI